MRLKELLQDKYTIAAVMQGDTCGAEIFLLEGEKAYEASREGLSALIVRISQHGLGGLSPKLCHLVDEKNGIFELIKGDLRLLFFHGQNQVVVVCCCGYLKKGKKVNKKVVAQAIRDKDAYTKGLIRNSIEWIEQEEDQNG